MFPCLGKVNKTGVPDGTPVLFALFLDSTGIPLQGLPTTQPAPNNKGALWEDGDGFIRIR